MSLIADDTMASASAVVQRPPAYLAVDRVIPQSYYCLFTDSRDAETLGKWNEQLVAQICHTGHFFRFPFAAKFVEDRNGRILTKWRARQVSNLRPPA